VLVWTLTGSLLSLHYVPSGWEIQVLIQALWNSLFDPVLLWLVYLAFEPYLRRYAPNTLIAWSRRLEGRWRDPLNGDKIAELQQTLALGCLLLFRYGHPSPRAIVSGWFLRHRLSA